MSKIKIKNFGPIKAGCVEADGWIDIKKVTVFIGNQGSGKSTAAKLISTFTWMEKALVRGNYDVRSLEGKGEFKNQLLAYHRLENYFRSANGVEITEIEYLGDAYRIDYKNGALHVEEAKKNRYALPQIMYVPAERNFVANVKSLKNLRLTSYALIEFVTEFDRAKEAIDGSLKLPINDVEIEYDRLNDFIHVKGTDYKIGLTEASSGFQSAVPLFLVSWFLSNIVQHKNGFVRDPMSSEELERFKKGVAEIWANESLTEEQRRIALSALSSRFNKTAFINIVEEPEQNLFPNSQWQMLKSLLEFNNMNPANKLLMTTHSPYLINFLSVAIQGGHLKTKMNGFGINGNRLEKLSAIIPENALIDAEDVAIYQFNETNGTIQKLADYEGVPSDKNYINMQLAEGNRLFDALLELEEAL